MMRRPQENLHSIERLYKTVRDNLPSSFRTRIVNATINSSWWIAPMIRDAWTVSTKQSDVNHVTGGAHFLTFFLKKSRTILTIHDLRNLDRLTGLRHHFYKLFWYTIPLKRCSIVVVISETTKQALVNRFAIDTSMIHVIPNTAPNINEKRHSSSKPERTILLIGTRPPKNLPRQLQALAQLNDLKPNILIIGELTAEQQILINQLNLSVENHVNVPNQELEKLYNSATFLLFASTEEGFGMPIIEAQAAGLPVITSTTSAMPEVAGDAALFVDPYSVDEIASAARRLLNDPVARTQLSKRGLKNCIRFTAETVASMYADLYRQVADNAASNVSTRAASRRGKQ